MELLSHEAWDMIGTASTVVLASVVIAAWSRIRWFTVCPNCKRRHATRSPFMSALDFWNAYCREGE